MKIEIDLKDILHDDYGDPTETLAESIRRQVIESLTAAISKGVEKKINDATARLINETMQAALKDRMDGLVGDLMDAEYRPVDRYGDKSREVTTFRKELVKAINEQMVYRKTSYSSDRNAFTKAVDDTVEQNMATFRAEFHKQVDGAFVSQAMGYAASELRKRLGIKA